jgi:hypothetical protein
VSSTKTQKYRFESARYFASKYQRYLPLFFPYFFDALFDRPFRKFWKTEAVAQKKHKNKTPLKST